MAEIILPPEENEETPQTPELNIDKPTENSKVITIEFEAKKTNKVSTKDTNQQLYTTDTDAWFEFKETSLEGANGTYSVVFRNRHDGSIFQRTGDVVNGVAYYKIPHQEIRHAGAWRGQVVYTLSNGDTTAREFDYDVKGHILDGKDVREIVVEDFETLMSQLRSMKDNAEVELANLVNTANQNETNRQAFFDDLVEDIDNLQANYQELLDTGVLQTNINEKLEELEEEYAPRLNEVTAQLAHKVGGGVKAEPEDLSSETLGLITGEGGPITIDSIPQNHSVTTEKIALDGLEPTTLKHVDKVPVRTVNLFDKESAVIGGYYNSDGSWIEQYNQASSDFIPVENLTRYKKTHGGTVVGWDENKEYVTHISDSDSFEITNPEIRFVTIAIYYESVNDNYMVTLEGEFPDHYVPYYENKYVLKGNWAVESYDKIIDELVPNGSFTTVTDDVGEQTKTYEVHGKILGVRSIEGEDLMISFNRKNWVRLYPGESYPESTAGEGLNVEEVYVRADSDDGLSYFRVEAF